MASFYESEQEKIRLLITINIPQILESRQPSRLTGGKYRFCLRNEKHLNVRFEESKGELENTLQDSELVV